MMNKHYNEAIGILKACSSRLHKDGEEKEDPLLDLLEGETISKPLPKKKKKKGESEFQHKIRQWTEEVKDRPERFPGGKDQAIAIAAEQSGETKKALNTRSFHIPRPIIKTDNRYMQTTRAYSGLSGNDGVAPLVGETLKDVSEDEGYKNRREQYNKQIQADKKKSIEHRNKIKQETVDPVGIWRGNLLNYR